MSDQSLDMPMNIEPVIAGQLPGDHGNQTNSNSGNCQANPKTSGVENQGVKSTREPPTPFIFNHKWLLLIFWAIGMLLYPLLAYTFVIGDETKCLQVDKSIGITIYVLLAALDIFNIILYIIFELPNDLRNEAGILHICWLLIKAVSMFPLSLLMIILFHTTTIRAVFSGGEAQALMLFLPRLLRLLLLSAKAISPSATFFGWAIKFIFSYVFMAQGFGAYWYLLAIFTEGNCWQKACGNHSGGCHDRDNILFSCKDSSEVYKFINDFCLRNTTKYDFGVFRDAHQSGILEMRGSAKIVYCFRWALQNISGFGQNLEAGTAVSGNMFVILIIFVAVGLFFFSLGQMQIYLHCDFVRLKRRGKKLKEIKLSTPFTKLPKNLRIQVMMHKRNLRREAKGDNIESVFYNLPEDLRKEMTKELCLDLLKKVEEFERWDEESLKDLCACLKPAFYAEQTHIIRENEPIDKMIFVVQGKLWIYTSGSEEGSTDDSSSTVLFCGEELVDRLQTNPSTSKLPVSKRTIQTVTNVEAFVLMAYDLKSIFIKRNETPVSAQGESTSNTVPAAQGENTINTVPAAQGASTGIKVPGQQ